MIAVPGGAAASRYPKYVSVRQNRARVGKSNRTFHCRFNFSLPPLENASIDDVLQVRRRRRTLCGMDDVPVLMWRVMLSTSMDGAAGRKAHAARTGQELVAFLWSTSHSEAMHVCVHECMIT